MLQNQKSYLAENYGVQTLGIFGSYVKKNQTSNSDLDILIELNEIRSVDLIDLIKAENYLSDLLNVKVDLVIKSDLKPRIGQRILKEVILL